jgi:hypothetical protein
MRITDWMTEPLRERKHRAVNLDCFDIREENHKEFKAGLHEANGLRDGETESSSNSATKVKRIKG